MEGERIWVKWAMAIPIFQKRMGMKSVKRWNRVMFKR